MSLYNMIHGYNPACIIFLPMLGRQYYEYPRFRNCFLSDDEKHILIYTRVGGGNRNCGYGEEELFKDPHFVRTWDDEEDSTYGYYEFSVPERWKTDFKAIVENGVKAMSAEYLKYLLDFHKEKPNICEQLLKIGQLVKGNGENCREQKLEA